MGLENQVHDFNVEKECLTAPWGTGKGDSRVGMMALGLDRKGD